VPFSIVGHSHQHKIRLLGPETGHAFWEVVSGSLADYRHQARVIEIWDQDNGWIMLRATNLDYRTDGDPLALEGRRIAIADYVSGWAMDGSGAPEDRNVELWIPVTQ
jgi:hypothetical protein